MTTSNAPDGITTAERDETLGLFILPDPMTAHTYFEDFDYFRPAEWTPNNETGSSETLTNEDGGVLKLTIGPFENTRSGLVKKGQSFLVESGKEYWMKIRFKKNQATTGYQIGLTELSNIDGLFFTNIVDSNTLGLVDDNVWTAAEGTVTGTPGTTVILTNTDSTSADASTTFETIVGASYTVQIDFEFTDTTATFTARDPSDNILGTLLTGVGDQFEILSFTAVSTITTLNWVNTSSTTAEASRIHEVITFSDRDSLVIAKNSIRTTLDLGVHTTAGDYVDFGVYYNKTKVQVYLNDEFINSAPDDNIPDTQVLSPGIEFYNSEKSNAQSADVDYFYAAKNR